MDHSNLIVKTKRLVIRPLTLDDYESWKGAFSGLGAKKNRWDWENLPKERLTKSSYCQSVRNHTKNMDSDSTYQLGVFEKKSGKLVGYTMLMDISRAIFQNAYIGYQLLNPFWGQGYGLEMVEGTVKMAFKKLKLHRVEAGISPNNRRSIKLAKKAGFRKEGRSKKRLFLNNEWKDFMIYALTVEDLSK
jgi:ribosomal-protein-alanine N-acetyltransferase